MRVASSCAFAIRAAVLAPDADARQRAKRGKSSADFAQPVRVMAGETHLGGVRYYP